MYVYRLCFFPVLAIGSQLVGSRSGIIETSLHLLLQVPNYIPEQKKFELGVLVITIISTKIILFDKHINCVF